MLDARSAATTASRRLRARARPRLAGRDRELALLSDAVDAAGTGSGTCVLVEGAAGMGKSRLLAETERLAKARHVTVLSARALPRDQTVPFSLALELFAPLVARADPATRDRYLDGAAQLVAPLLSGQPACGAAGGPPLQYGLFWLAVNITQSCPIAVLVDDAHWADDASLHFLAQLVRSVDELPAVVVIGTRTADPGVSAGLFELTSSAHVQSIHLDPLDGAAVADLVRQEFPDADDEFCRTCAEVTSGSPFHLSELLHCIRDEHADGSQVNTASVAELGRVSVSRAALFRLARLGGPAVALARALAVLGDDTPLRRVAALAGLTIDEAVAAADALGVEGLVRAGRSLSFTHPLIAEMILAERPPTSVAQDHARAAALLAAEHEPAEKCAVHLLHAPAVADQSVVATLVDAAAAAHGRGAPDVAVAYLSRALEEPPAPTTRRDVLCLLGAAGATLGEPAAVEHLEQALELSDTLDDRLATRRLMGRALAASGRPRDAALCLEAVVTDLLAGDPRRPAAAELMPVVAEYLTVAVLETGLRQRAFELAAALLDPHAGGDDPASRSVMAALALRSAQDGRPVAETICLAERAWAEGAVLADGPPDRSPWLTVNWAFALAGDYRQAVNVATAARNEARRLGLAEVAATASVFRSMGLFSIGRIAAAREELGFVLQAAEREGWRRYRVGALSVHAMLCIESDALDQAADAVMAAESCGAQTGIEAAWLNHARGALALARQDPAAACDEFTAAGEWLREHLGAADMTILPWRPAAARAALALGDRERAREVIAADRDLAVAIGDRGRLGRALAVLALIDRDNEPVLVLEEACELLTETGELLERARAQKDMGALLRRAGDRAAARSVLSGALDSAARLGATALVRSIRDELAAAGARPRSDRTSGPHALTASERRIAQLVADGLTNGRIAQQLFVTPKTVEYHLRNVFQKLAITNRSEVGDALRAVDGD